MCRKGPTDPDMLPCRNSGFNPSQPVRCLDEYAVAFRPDGNVRQETVCRKCSSNIGRLHRGGAAAPPMLKDFADRIREDVVRLDGPGRHLDQANGGSTHPVFPVGK